MFTREHCPEEVACSPHSHTLFVFNIIYLCTPWYLLCLDVFPWRNEGCVGLVDPRVRRICYIRNNLKMNKFRGVKLLPWEQSEASNKVLGDQNWRYEMCATLRDIWEMIMNRMFLTEGFIISLRFFRLTGKFALKQVTISFIHSLIKLPFIIIFFFDTE